MKGSFRKQLAKLTVPVALAVLVAFASGQRAQSERVDRVHAEADDVWMLVDDGVARSEGRSIAAPAEKARWTAIADLFDRALPAGDVRLAFSREVAQLATRAGVESFTLQETPFEELPATSPYGAGDAYDDVYDGGSGDGSYDEGSSGGFDDERPARPVAVEVVPHVYTIGFEATYDELARFVTGLGHLSALVELESVVVERTAPTLDVSMKVAAYGRVSG